ncbi:MAG: GNAT family N-acetyltransferase [Burkholderiaceae bacterium]|nr:GNAT family N-acetyltransferase [Burkholderiaceae bacterium]
MPRAWQGDAFSAALETVLHTPRLRLEPQRPEHADALFSLLGDARLYTHIPQEPPPSLDVLRERLALLSTRRSPQGDELWLNWVVRDAREGALLGRVQATVRADAPCYLAYEVFPAHWRRGIATEACRRAMHWLIDELQVEQFTAEVDSLNTASLRLLQRLGFRRVSLRANADRFKGRASDEWMLRLDAADFVRGCVASPASR